MIRKRFPAIRTLRISAWTTIALAWGIAIIGRQMEAPAAEETVAPEPVSTTSTVVQAETTMPTMPEDGLIVIRYTPAPPPPPIVRQVVVSGPAPSPGVSRSQGS